MGDSPTVAIVTGASRGAGRGIAIALGSHGCTVYVTGRSQQRGDHTLGGTIHETAEAVTAAGGKGVAVACDHADDAQVAALFERVARDEGRLDILVNNAAAICDELTTPGNFFEKPLKLADLIDVGVRSGYVASWHAAQTMVPRRSGLIVFTSSSGAVHYVFGAAYGAHKAAMDKMAWDMAIDLKPFDVAALSIWMGAVRTERLKLLIDSDPDKYAGLDSITETPEFTGHIIWALYQDPALMDRSGQTLIGAEVAAEFGLRDEGDRQPMSYRDMHKVFPHAPFPNVTR